MSLIITCPRNLEIETQEEIDRILTDFDDVFHQITITKLAGILIVITDINTEKFLEKVREKIISEPWYVRYCLRMIPIQVITDTTIDDITSEVLKLIKIIKTDSYKITIEKRDSKISSKEIIFNVAKNITNKVSLDNANWEILIEIVGNKTGIAIIKPDTILSITKIKRSLSE